MGLGAGTLSLEFLLLRLINNTTAVQVARSLNWNWKGKKIFLLHTIENKFEFLSFAVLYKNVIWVWFVSLLIMQMYYWATLKTGVEVVLGQA